MSDQSNDQHAPTAVVSRSVMAFRCAAGRTNAVRSLFVGLLGDLLLRPLAKILP